MKSQSTIHGMWPTVFDITSGTPLSSASHNLYSVPLFTHPSHTAEYTVGAFADSAVSIVETTTVISVQNHTP